MTLPEGLRVPAWMLVAALAVATYGIGRWDGRETAEEVRIMRDAKAWLATGTAYRATLRGVLEAESAAVREARQQQAKATQHAQEAAGLARTADSLLRIVQGLTAATPLDTACGPFSRALSACTVARQSLANSLADQQAASVKLELARRKADERADLATARAEGADAHLAEVLRVKGCHLLFLPCPSRTVAAVGGAVIGAVTVWTLLR